MKENQVYVAQGLFRHMNDIFVGLLNVLCYLYYIFCILCGINFVVLGFAIVVYMNQNSNMAERRK